MSQLVSSVSAPQASNASGSPRDFPNIDKILRAIRDFFVQLRERGFWVWSALTNRRVVAISGAIAGVSSVVGCFSPRLASRLREGALFSWAVGERAHSAQLEAEKDALKKQSAAQSEELARLRADVVLRENNVLRVQQLRRTVEEQRKAQLAAIPARVEMEAELAKAKETTERLAREVAVANARAAKAEAERDQAVVGQQEERLRVSRQVVEVLCNQIAQAHQRGKHLGDLYQQLQSNYREAHEAQGEEFQRLFASLPTDDPNRPLFEGACGRLTDLYNVASMQLVNAYLYATVAGVKKADFSLTSLVEACTARSQELIRVSKLPCEKESAASLIAAQRLLDDGLAITERVIEVCKFCSTTSTQEV